MICAHHTLCNRCRHSRRRRQLHTRTHVHTLTGTAVESDRAGRHTNARTHALGSSCVRRPNHFSRTTRAHPTSSTANEQLLRLPNTNAPSVQLPIAVVCGENRGRRSSRRIYGAGKCTHAWKRRRRLAHCNVCVWFGVCVCVGGVCVCVCCYTRIYARRS